MPGKRIDERTKEKVIEDCSEGISRKEIAAKYGISPRSVTRIAAGLGVKKESAGPNADAARRNRIEDLERRLELLEKRVLALDAKKRF